jgi:phage repressor protein C with HTH and peptisase S24 domain
MHTENVQDAGMKEETRPEPAIRLEQARLARGFAKAIDAANFFGWKYVTYTQHESGERGLIRAAEQYAKAYRVSAGWLLTGEGKGPEGIIAPDLDLEPSQQRPKSRPNASFPPKYQQFPTDSSIPLLGQSIGGPNGRFVLNGSEVGRVFCPPGLEGVEGAYAVRVFGTSMEPRYMAGETVWLNPQEPVRANDDVVAQILQNGDDQPVESYIKQFVSRSSKVLRLRQHNPEEGESKELEFDNEKVFSVHKIVFHATV